MAIVRPTATPFYRLETATDWKQSENSEGIVQDPVSAQLRLGKPGDFPIPINEPMGSFGGMTLPRGVTVADDGRVLLADPAHNRILYYDNLSCDQSSENLDTDVPCPFRLLWQSVDANPPNTISVGDGQLDECGPDKAIAHELFSGKDAYGAYDLLQPADVLFSPSGEIVVADTGHSRVLIYSWPDLRLRQSIEIPASAPVALAYDSRQRLYVADAANGKVWRINRLWQVDHYFYGADEQLISPGAVAIDSTDNVLILDQKTNQIVLLSSTGDVSVIDPLTGSKGAEVFSLEFRVPPFRLTDDGLEYPQLQKSRCEALYLKPVKLDKSGYLAGSSLALMARPRSIRLPRSGIFYSQQLDNKQYASQWHRIVMQGEVSSTTAILVQTHTGDRSIGDTEIVDLDWSETMLLSSGQPGDRLETLIQSGKGRYLHLRIELMGDGSSTPLINNIQVFGPRLSSLSYLPRPYHQDPESVYFLDRFLSYFDTIQEENRFLINDFTRYLDPQGVPEGPFLEWLGSWFDWRFLAQWPTDLRREMISSSIELYKKRGTLEGLKQMLQWHTGLKGGQPEIIEHFRLRNYAEILGHEPESECDERQLFIAEKPFTQQTEKLAHWFSVVLPISAVPNEEAHQLINELIEAQKPAHTAFQICVFSPGIRIGKQSSIGIDTWLGHYPEEPVGSLTLGQSSALTSTVSSGMRIGQQHLN